MTELEASAMSVNKPARCVKGVVFFGIGFAIWAGCSSDTVPDSGERLDSESAVCGLDGRSCGADFDADAPGDTRDVVSEDSTADIDDVEDAADTRDGRDTGLMDAGDTKECVPVQFKNLGTMKDDRDHDGVPDPHDNCPETSNYRQNDSNRNGIGNACDPTETGTCRRCVVEGAPCQKGLECCTGRCNSDGECFHVRHLLWEICREDIDYCHGYCAADSYFQDKDSVGRCLTE